MDERFRLFLDLLNETLATAIVVITASMLLYNITRNQRNRVARTSGIVLACVTIIYTSDVLVSLGPGPRTFESLLRLQWVGLVFLPTAVFHLSDALLATTGLPSRGRRRRIIRLLYANATGFLLLATFSDWLVTAEQIGSRSSLRAAPGFALYAIYYVIVNSVAYFNVQRARKRCLTRTTRRRMSLLQITILTPVIGVFPYSVLLPLGEEFSVVALILVNLANLLVVLMLLFLSYPLSFFGSSIPDRVVKAELLRFMLRGPATGLWALVVIIYTVPASDFLGILGTEFMPFAVVAVILFWQWSVDLSLPWLERRLIYSKEDDEQLSELQRLSDRLLTRSDLQQLIEAILVATCDYLRVNSAFVAAFSNGTSEIVERIRAHDLTEEMLEQSNKRLIAEFTNGETPSVHKWESFWVLPLYSGRNSGLPEQATLIGMIGVQARADEIDLTIDDQEVLHTFVRRTARTLDDMFLQTEVSAALEGLLPQFSVTRKLASEIEYGPGRDATFGPASELDREQIIEQVHAALRHYWGGPGLSESRLLELQIVRRFLPEHDNNIARALRAVLETAIKNLSPEGERDYKSPEWTLYNILTLRFIENRKARETARRLYMSEANLYRKQNIAIEAVTDIILQLEREAILNQSTL